MFRQVFLEFWLASDGTTALAIIVSNPKAAANFLIIVFLQSKIDMFHLRNFLSHLLKFDLSNIRSNFTNTQL
jgi:hypothetical protein